MGAVDYSSLELVKGNSSDAFNQAVEDANSYNGHQEGYSGDIQTANGFRMITDHPRFETKAFWKWEADKLNEMGKGDCYCIELTGTTLKKLKERRYLKGKKGWRAFYFFGVGRC